MIKAPPMSPHMCYPCLRSIHGAEPLPSHPPAQPSECVRRCDAAVRQANRPTGSRCEAGPRGESIASRRPKRTRRNAGLANQRDAPDRVDSFYRLRQDYWNALDI
jgi:hypothetical protein